MCASVAGQRGRRVLVLDHSDKLAEKSASLARRPLQLHQSQHPPRALSVRQPALCALGAGAIQPVGLYQAGRTPRHRLPRKTLGQLFCDDSAQQIIDLLDAECADGGVTRRLGCAIHSVAQRRRPLCAGHRPRRIRRRIAGGGHRRVLHPRHRRHPWGYRLAEQFGLAVTPLKPGLVPLTFDAAEQHAFGPLAGLSLDIAASLGKASFREQGLFTHKGVSGPAILQISSYWQAGKPSNSTCCPAPTLTTCSAAAHSEQKLSNVLAQAWPKRFAVQWLAAQGVADAPCASSTPKP